MLLEAFLKLVREIAKEVFPQERTGLRATRLMLCGLLTMGRCWITRMIGVAGRDQQDWSADYRLFSRSPWEASRLFLPVICRTIAMAEDQYVSVALDETGVRRGGNRVKAARWSRDPLSPPFQTNFVKSLRFLHFSALVRDHGENDARCRGVPVGFEMVEVVKKPGKRASPDAWKAYREEKKRKNMSVSAAQAIRNLRQLYDETGGQDKILIIPADGSFCNNAVMGQEYERTVVLARARKDASLCRQAPPGERRYYDAASFTPEQVRKDETIPWQKGVLLFGGEPRELLYKEVGGVLWRKSTRRKPLRLLVLAPTPYRTSPNARERFRDPSYLLTRDQETPAEILIQSYLDRWQIEVNHRDLKDTVGLGEAQVWSDRSVPRQPAFVVASYSALLLTSLEAYGSKRTGVYEPLPKWRRKAARPSCLDLLTQLRKEAMAAGETVESLGFKLDSSTMIKKAAA